MAVIKQGILGGGSGKVANVTMTSWKGRAVIKGRPLSVANPRTAGQVTNRGAFSQVSKFASLILASLIVPLMNRFAGDISGCNLFVKRNKGYFDSDGIFDGELINFGTGKLGTTILQTCSVDVSAEEAVFNWPTALDNQFKLATDKAYAMVIHFATGEVVYQGDTGAVRSDGTATLPLSEVPVLGNTYGCYLIFLRADGTQVGDTAFNQANAVA